MVPRLGQLHEAITGGSVRTESGKNVNAACVAETSSVRPQRGTKSVIRHLHKDHEAEWKLVLAASSRSAQAEESERRGTRRGTTKKTTAVVPHSWSYFYLVICTRNFGWEKKSHRNSKPLFCSFKYKLYTGRPVSCRVKLAGRLIGRVDVVVVVL